MKRFVLVVIMILTTVPAFSDFTDEYNSGIYFYKRSEYDLAAQSFESAIRRFPGDPRLDAALYWCGQSHDLAGKYGSSKQRYQRLIEDFPSSSYRLDAILAAGQACMNLRSYAEALEFFRRIEPESTEPGVFPSGSKQVLAGLFKSVECYLKLGRDAEAERVLRDILKSPKLPKDRLEEAQFRLKQVLTRTGRVFEAKTIQITSSKNSDLFLAEEYLSKADGSYAEGKFGESRTWYDQAQKLNVPGDVRAQALYGSARSLMGMGEHRRAMKLFEEVLSNKDALPVERGDAALQLALIHRQSGNFQKAAEIAQSGERIAEESGQPKLRNDLYFFRGEFYYSQKNFPSAMDVLTKMSEAGYRVNRLTGLIQLDSGRAKEAAEQFERAELTAPDEASRNDVIFHHARARAAEKQNEWVLRDLDRIQNPSAGLLEQMRPLKASALMEAGRFSEAAKEYDLLATSADDPERAKRYRFQSVLASFKDKNFSWAEQLLADLTQAGGIPDGAGSDPAVFLQQAIDIDRAIGLTAHHKQENLDGQLEEFLERSPDTPLYFFTIERLARKEFHSVLPKFAKALLRSMRPSEQAYGRAAYLAMMSQRANRQWPDAAQSIQLLEKWCSFYPQSPLVEEAAYWRGKVAEESGRVQEAADAYRSYVQKYPAGKYVNQVYLQLGTLSYAENQSGDAEEAFSKLIRGKTPQEIAADPSLSKVVFDLANIRMRQKRHEDAAQLLEWLGGSDVYKNDLTYRLRLADAYQGGEKYSAAARQYRVVIDHPGASAELSDKALESLLTALQRGNLFSEFEKDYRKYSSRLKDKTLKNKSNYLMGTMLFKQERYSEAAAFLDGVQDPRGSDMVMEARLRRADCDFVLRRYAEALDRYSKIIKDVPQSKWAEESFVSSGLCKIRLGQTEDVLSSFEKFLRDNPNAAQAASVALEAAKLYFQAEDLDAADRMLDFYEKRSSGAPNDEILRMRLTIYKRRGQYDRVVAGSKQHRGLFGMQLDVAINGASAATRIFSSYDPFELSKHPELADAMRHLEDIFSPSRAKNKVFPVETKFYDRGSRVVDVENTLSGTIKRILFTPSRVLLLIEARAISIMNEGAKITIKKVTLSNKPLQEIEDSFMSGLQINQEFVMHHNQTKLFAISFPRTEWSNDVLINLDIEFIKRELLLYARVRGMKE